MITLRVGRPMGPGQAQERVRPSGLALNLSMSESEKRRHFQLFLWQSVLSMRPADLPGHSGPGETSPEKEGNEGTDHSRERESGY